MTNPINDGVSEKDLQIATDIFVSLRPPGTGDGYRFNIEKIAAALSAQRRELTEAGDRLAKVIREYQSAVDDREIITKIFHCYGNGKEALSHWEAFKRGR